jgi:hypothetical protein
MLLETFSVVVIFENGKNAGDSSRVSPVITVDHLTLTQARDLRNFKGL